MISRLSVSHVRAFVVCRLHTLVLATVHAIARASLHTYVRPSNGNGLLMLRRVERDQTPNIPAARRVLALLIAKASFPPPLCSCANACAPDPVHHGHARLVLMAATWPPWAWQTLPRRSPLDCLAGMAGARLRPACVCSWLVGAFCSPPPPFILPHQRPTSHHRP